jgi:hypothetical protein
MLFRDSSKERFPLRSWSRLDQAPTKILDLIGSHNATALGFDWILQLEAHTATPMPIEVERSTDPLTGRAPEELTKQASPRQRVVPIGYDLNLVACPDLESVLEGGAGNVHRGGYPRSPFQHPFGLHSGLQRTRPKQDCTVKTREAGVPSSVVTMQPRAKGSDHHQKPTDDQFLRHYPLRRWITRWISRPIVLAV